MNDRSEKKFTLIITSVAMFMTPFTISSLNVALPTIGKEFSMDAVILGWVTTALTLSTVMFTLPIGRLADILGMKKFLIAGFLINIVAYIGSAIAPTSTTLIISRVFQGIAGAFMMATGMAIVTYVFPPEERGKALGINMAMLYFGASIGPFLGGLITQQLGWRNIFYFGAIVYSVIVILTLWKLKGEWAGAKGEKFDLIGSLTSTLTIFLILYGLTRIITVIGIILILLGGLLLVVFIRWEARFDSPILNINVFRKNMAFVFSNLATLIIYISVAAMFLLLSLYLQYCKGLTPQTAGLLLIIQPATMALFSPIAGWFSDRFEARKVASIGMALSCIGLMIFVTLNEASNLRVYIIGSVILGAGYGLFSTSNANLVMGSVEKKFLGVAAATRSTMLGIGMMISMSIVLVLFSIFLGDVQITPAYYPAFLMSMRVSITIFIVFCFCGIFVQLAGKKVQLH